MVTLGLSAEGVSKPSKPAPTMPKSVVQKATDDFVLRMGHCTLNLMGMALENLRRYDVEHRNGNLTTCYGF